MKIKLGWITVKDLTKAKQFFTKLGLSVKTEDQDHGWLELEGATKEFTLGVWQEGKALGLPGKAGSNAIMTFYVEDIVKAKKELEAKGITFTSEVYILPHGAKIADFVDQDGNKFQIVQDS